MVGKTERERTGVTVAPRCRDVNMKYTVVTLGYSGAGRGAEGHTVDSCVSFTVGLLSAEWLGDKRGEGGSHTVKRGRKLWLSRVTCEEWGPGEGLTPAATDNPLPPHATLGHLGTGNTREGRAGGERGEEGDLWSTILSEVWMPQRRITLFFCGQRKYKERDT